MKPNYRFLSYILFAIGVALLTGTVLFYLHFSQPAPVNLTDNTPQMLADLPLVHIITGQEAIDSIHQLYGEDFPLDDGIVAIYGNQNVILWVSDAGSVANASDLIVRMKARITEGDSPFVESGNIELNGVVVYVVEGMGQKQYYWQAGKLVLWLAADNSIAQKAIAECVAFYK